MSMEELMEQMIYERIDMLLRQRSDEEVQREETFHDDMEAFLNDLSRDLKERMEYFWNEWISYSAADNRYLYLAGMKDGIRISKRLSEL